MRGTSVLRFADRVQRVATAIANDLIDFVANAKGVSLALLVFALVFGESFVVTDFVVPGEVGLVVAGAAAAGNGTALPLVIGGAVLGAIAGDTAGYLIGRTVGTDVIKTKRWARRLSPALHRAEDHFRRHGGRTVFAARWVGALRGVVPPVAGSARLSAPRFYAASVPAAVAWSTLLATVGFVWGDEIADVIDRLGLAVSAVVVVVLVAVLLWSRHRRKQRGRQTA